MQWVELKDIVREHFSRTEFPTTMLELALQSGRREIEKAGNFWWMKDETTFNLVADDAEYVIGSGLEINEANFKDARALHWKTAADVSWEPVELGTIDKDELDLMYDTDDEGSPEFAVLNNDTLFIYPPKPQVAYNMKLYHYNWTVNPTDNTASADVVVNRFPEALIYASLAWGYQMYLKDLNGAEYWTSLLHGPMINGRRNGGEIAKIKRENLKRDWQDKIILVPRRGPGIRRRLENLQIYGNRIS